MNYEQLIAALHGAAWALSNGDGGAELHRVIHALEAEYATAWGPGVHCTAHVAYAPSTPVPGSDAPVPESDAPADLPASELDAAE
jgi:hypothetical protein